MEEKELSSEEIEAMRKELAEIKSDMMRKELEEIKKERMRKELEDIRREREMAAQPPAAPKVVYVQAPAARLSPVNIAISAVMLLVAGYLAGTLYSAGIAGGIDSFLAGLSLPVSLSGAGTVIVAVLAIVLAAIGTALITIARK